MRKMDINCQPAENSKFTIVYIDMVKGLIVHFPNDSDLTIIQNKSYENRFYFDVFVLHVYVTVLQQCSIIQLINNPFWCKKESLLFNPK